MSTGPTTRTSWAVGFVFLVGLAVAVSTIMRRDEDRSAQASEQAVLDLALLLRKGEDSEWTVEYESTRRRDGSAELTQAEVFIRRSDLVLSGNDAALRVVLVATGRTVDCTRTADRPLCIESSGSEPSEGVGVSALIGALARQSELVVQPAGQRVVAGVPADCWVVVATGTFGGEFAGDWCLDDAGIVRYRSSSIDGVRTTQSATNVRGRASDAEVDARLTAFGVTDFAT